MRFTPTQITLELEPQARFELIDVTRWIAEHFEDFFSSYARTLYCSLHTTAGFLEQSVCARLGYRRERLSSFLGVFRQLFPPGASYRHDHLDLREELSEAQRRVEPRNADSHLAFIGSGLESCVTYRNRPGTAVHLVDLDGVHDHGHRKRKAVALGFNLEEPVARDRFLVRVSPHPIDSVNLKCDQVGLMPRIRDLLQQHRIAKGRVDISLAAEERHSGLTVNEFETLLMRHDLAEVLDNPLRFMAARGRSALRQPRAIPSKTLDYARYDLVQVINQLMDLTGMSESIVERAVARFLAMPARRFLRIKRSISLLVSDRAGGEIGEILQGAYQSPVLMQWSKSPTGRRQLEFELVRFC